MRAEEAAGIIPAWHAVCHIYIAVTAKSRGQSHPIPGGILMRKTLLFTALTLGLGLALPAMAQDNTSNQKDNTIGGNNSSSSSSTDSSMHTKTVTITPSGNDRSNSGDVNSDGMGPSAANNGGTAVSSVNDAFNTSTAVANTTLDGAV